MGTMMTSSLSLRLPRAPLPLLAATLALSLGGCGASKDKAGRGQGTPEVR